MKRSVTISKIVLLLCTSILMFGQDVQNSRRISQKVETTRTIGSTDIKIVYHSPLVKGRKIFGGIVPYDFVVDGKEYAWRAGSNERTIIEFEHDVVVNNHALKAGKYGLVVLVSEKQWTFVFTNNYSWGAFQYEPSQDILRVTVSVNKVPHQEWLSYRFTNPSSESINMTLHWANTSASLNIKTDVGRNIINSILKKENKVFRDFLILAEEYRNIKKSDSAWLHLKNANLKIDDKKTQDQKFAFNILKAELLIEKGEQSKGQKLLKETLKSSKGFNMYYYGLSKLFVQKNKDEAYKLLRENIKNNPQQWQGYLALGEYYLHENNQKKVVENFKKAYEFAPANWKNYARYLFLQNKLVMDRTSNK